MQPAQRAESPTRLTNEPITWEHNVHRVCGCGRAFQTIIGRMGDRVVIHGGRLCAPCADERELKIVQPGEARDVRALLADAGVNVKKHGDCTLDNWEGVESNKPLQAANDFVRDVVSAGRSQGVRGLYLCGESGTGKTHLATGILRALLQDQRVDPRRIVFDRAARLITEIQDTYGSGATEKVLEKREQALVWVLDDLGAEKATEDVLRILTDLMSAREGHANVITSNYEPGLMAERWDKAFGWMRLASRLGTENFAAVRVRGRDRRLQPTETLLVDRNAPKIPHSLGV